MHISSALRSIQNYISPPEFKELQHVRAAELSPALYSQKNASLAQPAFHYVAASDKSASTHTLAQTHHTRQLSDISEGDEDSASSYSTDSRPPTPPKDPRRYGVGPLNIVKTAPERPLKNPARKYINELPYSLLNTPASERSNPMDERPPSSSSVYSVASKTSSSEADTPNTDILLSSLPNNFSQTSLYKEVFARFDAFEPPTFRPEEPAAPSITAATAVLPETRKTSKRERLKQYFEPVEGRSPARSFLHRGKKWVQNTLLNKEQNPSAR